MKIFTLDSTLRAGTRAEDVSFTVDDKLVIVQKLDELGIDYIEGGWPGSDPRDREFFARAKELRLRHAKLAAFGATRFARNSVQQDRGVKALLEAATAVVTIFGDSRSEQSLELIAQTVRYLRDRGKDVVYDAEHFFDGYEADAGLALRSLEAAQKAGAGVLVLCDTSGGALTGRLAEIVAEVRQRLGGILGIQAYNDSDLAVANTLAAVEQGCTHVQGCINGYGERCGAANLCSVIANLELKQGHTTIGHEKLQGLSAAARLVAELANLPLRSDQPFVGPGAFAHKGGAPASAVLKDAASSGHIAPEAVGNRESVLVSDLSGRANLLYKLKQHGLADRLSDEAHRELMERIQEMEYLGCQLEAAEGTFELLVRQALDPGLKFFDVESYEVTTKSAGAGSRSTATVNLRAQDGVHSATASGHGPVHALDLCLRKCLATLYPQIASVRLTDYKVRVLEPKRGTAARVRALIEWSDQRKSWSTAGVSDNVIEASWNAIVDAIRLELMRLSEKDESIERAVEDYCWGV